MSVELLTNAEIRSMGLRPQMAVVTDLRTGRSYNIFWGGAPQTHTDFSPFTLEDAQTMREISSTWNWNPRPVILKIQNRKLAASVHHFPHGSIIGGNPRPLLNNNSNNRNTTPNDGRWSTNPFGGHMCMWYKDSRPNSGSNTTNYALGMRRTAQEAFILGLEIFNAEDEKMTQTQFNEMMNVWLADRGDLPSLGWAIDQKIEERAIKAGIVTPGQKNNFERPRSLATREETAAMILRAIGK